MVFTVQAMVDAGATGSLVNTASVAAPEGVGDAVATNDSATDVDALTPRADLAVTKTDDRSSVTPGETVTYTVVAGNAGPSAVDGARVTDFLPAALIAVTWTCEAPAGTFCTPAGSGDVDDTVDLPPGTMVTYTVSATVAGGATGEVINTATVAPPAGVTENAAADNSATDVDLVVLFADGFESGDASAWTVTLPVALADSGGPVADFLHSFDFAAASRPAGLRPSRLVTGFSPPPGQVEIFAVELRRLDGGAGGLELRAGARRDTGAWQWAAWAAIDAGARSLELSWRRAWAPGFADGELAVAVDGALVLWLDGLDNDRHSLAATRIRGLEFAGSNAPRVASTSSATE